MTLQSEIILYDLNCKLGRPRKKLSSIKVNGPLFNNK